MTAAWLWLTAGLIVGAAEALAPGLFLLPIGVAAVLSGVVLFTVALGFAETLLVFCLFAALGIVVARRLYGRGTDHHNASTLNRRADGLVGRVYTLESPLTSGSGRVRVDDSVWRVTGPDLPVGTRVRVTRIMDGGTLLDVVAE